MKNKIFIFDLDNTICKTVGSNYSKSKPKKKIIKLVNKLKNNGHTIIIYTARYMGRYKGKSNLVKKKYFKKTQKCLVNWGLEFDKLIMGKPQYDYFIDDKSLNPLKDNLKVKFKKYL